MAYQFPKCILEEGAETQIDKINNTCRRTILETVKGVLKDELVQKDIQERFDKVHNEMAQLKETMSRVTGPSHTEGKTRASEIPGPSHTEGKDQDKSSHSPGPSAAKGKAKGKAAESLPPPTVRRSPRPVRKDVQNSEDDMMNFLKNLSQSSNIKVEMETQEYLQDAVGNLSQSSYVKGFDPSQKLNGEEPAECVTPLTSFKPADWRPPTLKDIDLHGDRVNDGDYSLVFVPEDSWAKLIKWSSTSMIGLLPSDSNIREARQKIAYDQWEAANDHVLISRMAQFTPPKTITNPVVELE
ncbi:hypothetical protein DY000_02029694 [Brassica cretica]|uniref:Uncharacterized protein n=1 Tax=Brassica cretica TaxID=69181 RepID=A0ABQ7DCD5_BRACR|nr:hypothetical protein DY000_02029694 [Brassica cretica]